MGPLTSLEREPNMKTRLLPVLLLTATFPLAALAQTSGSGNGGSSSSSDQGTTNPNGTGGTSSSGTSSDNGTTTNNGMSTSPNGTGGTSSSSNNDSSSGSNLSTGASATGGTSSANGSGTGAPSTSGATASAETMVTIPGAAAVTVADLRGKTVYGVDGSSLGQINEVLASADGAANAVVIGVGGKNVVVNLSALQMAPSQATGATGTDTMSSNSAGTSSAQANAASASNDRIVLNMTREQLEQAPAYTGSTAP